MKILFFSSLIQGKGKSKEGFSLFKCFEKLCKTYIGKTLLKNWFLSPTYDINVLKYR